MSPRQIIFTAVMVLMLAIAWRRGGRWERLAALALVAATVGTYLAQDRADIRGPQYGMLAVDGALFVALTAIALASNRAWPLWAAGLQLFGVSIHLARIVDPQVAAHAFYRGLSIYSYAVIAAVMIGAWTHKRE